MSKNVANTMVKLKIAFKKLSLIKINGVIIALELSKNIYCTHKSVLRAGTKPFDEVSRTWLREQLHIVLLKTFELRLNVKGIIRSHNKLYSL